MEEEENINGEKASLLNIKNEKSPEIFSKQIAEYNQKTSRSSEESLQSDAKKRALFRWKVISMVTQNSTLRAERRHVIAENTLMAMKAKQVAFVPKRKTVFLEK